MTKIVQIISALNQMFCSKGRTTEKIQLRLFYILHCYTVKSIWLQQGVQNLFHNVILWSTFPERDVTKAVNKC